MAKLWNKLICAFNNHETEIVGKSPTGNTLCRCSRCGKESSFYYPEQGESPGLTSTPINILLFCPNCGEQHIDEAKPDNCEDCGHVYKWHFESDRLPSGRVGCGHPNCNCNKFNAWLNPPHKSHRCHECNHVWRPSDVPTNGVATIEAKGKAEHSRNARPRYFATAEDFNRAIKLQD